MRLYRKIVAKISKDSIRSLVAAGLIEVEENKLQEAELDLAAVMVEYLNADEDLNEKTRSLLNKHGLGMDRFWQTKKILAESEDFKIGNDAIDYILTCLLNTLLTSKNIAEVFGDDFELRKNMRISFDKYTSISEDLDKEARGMLKNLRQGSSEWEIEYPRAVAQIRKRKGL